MRGTAEADPKKPSFLSRLMSTLDKDVLAKFPPKKQRIQSPAGRLPQELAESIIDHLWYHFDSLLACCLTCRAWVEPSRYHLFYRRRLIYEHQYKSLPTLRRYGLIDYIRRIELDLLPPFNNKSPTFRYLKEMGPAPYLRALALTDYIVFHLPESTTLAQTTISLVSLELTNPGGSSNEILGFICMFPNLDNLSVANHSKGLAKRAPRCETSPSFRGVLTLKDVICLGEDGFVQGLLDVPGGLRFRELILKCSIGVEPLIPACSQTLRTLFYQPRLGAAVDLELLSLNEHFMLEKIETVICSRASVVPPIYLDHLASKISSPNFRDLIITTHDHDFHDLFSILSSTAGKVADSLFTRRNGAPNTGETKVKLTLNIEDPLWSNRDRDQLVREICPAILEESEGIVIVQKRNFGWVGVCHDQSGANPMPFIG